ncbi:DUF4430 domain-containing protein [Vagococcus carniphilus]|uniref:DUF4430 domain-containing protein n=1 Tax=Vagococcus carniphilus TaxID=218144 RepID=UPI00289208D7|nr:DUF4430 domain-containing protein [Vagococcus carniphilus]MDT2815014.1 DUF4430 domain-containing protein [Vagococcus carniphilus]MDT2864990.1 DUF4430 domain-containing protein [Vagococcus carniphilus]
MKKDFLIVVVLLFFGAFLFKGTKIQSVDDYYLTHIDDITPESETVTLSIEAKTLLDNMDKLDENLRSEKYVPDNGVILKETEVVLRNKDTVFDLLNRTTRYNKIQFDYQGSDNNSFGSNYIKGINYLYEFSAGPLSGWMYKVNGKFPDYGVSKYLAKDKDKIEIIYTCDLGRDIGGGFNNESEK